APLLLRRFEVDALYEVLEVAIAALDGAGVPYCLVAGSLLGAVRSNSILFCDDDVDIAVVGAEHLAAARAALREARVRAVAHFAERPWPACDRLRPLRATATWIDVFCLRQFDTEADVRAFVYLKANGQPQDAAIVEACCATVEDYPIFHYDAPKAISLWPREFFTRRELLPLRADLRFGPLTGLCGPRHVVGHLCRAFGADVFDCYVIRDAHGRAADVAVDTKLALLDGHFPPVQHSKRVRRVASDWTRARLHAELKSLADDEALSLGARPKLDRLDGSSLC
ncbi:hypothetical protein M885DRAFT_44686, partial [Pelagophyceae sp. CCMP2097]